MMVSREGGEKVSGNENSANPLRTNVENTDLPYMGDG
jgi:hypothetical protein